jgi:6-phosphofructokinase 2
MIHTVTVNPALDLTYRVPAIKIDDKIRARRVYRAAGGNGINVSRVAVRLNYPTVAIGFAGGRTGNEIEELLQGERVETWFTRTKAQTRTNAIIHDDENKQIRVSSPGADVLPDEVVALELSIFDLRRPEFLVIAGGLLKGLPEDFYLRLIRKATRQNIRVVADVDRELKEVVAAGVYLIKPNQYELERLTGVHIETYDDALKASRVALGLGVKVVVCSLGPLGAVLVTETEAWKAVPPKVQVDSAVGAGDSLLAGVLVASAKNQSCQQMLRLGVACGTATATTPGTQLCHKDTIDTILPEVNVEALATNIA